MRSRGGLRFLAEFGLVIGGLLALSALIRLLDLDLRVARWFYQPDGAHCWWAEGRQPWEIIYRYGTWPANLLGAASLVGLLAAFFYRRLRRHRRSLLALVLVLALGPGLIVNTLLKEHWGRPRPRDMIEFGGTEAFVPVGTVGQPDGNEGFPSGHAAMGFYFLSLYILWRGRRPRAAMSALVGGLAAGGLLGFQRIAAGAHFLSDVLWSGGIVYLTALGVDYVLGPPRAPRSTPAKLPSES